MQNKKSNYYYVRYVIDATSYVKKFKTKAAMTKFINEFNHSQYITNEDNWIDMAFHGHICDGFGYLYEEDPS